MKRPPKTKREPKIIEKGFLFFNIEPPSQVQKIPNLAYQI